MANHISVHDGVQVYEGDGQTGDVWVSIGAIRLPTGGCEVVLGRGPTKEEAEAEARKRADEWWREYVKSQRVPTVGGS